ncbi:LMBR1-like membrane protein-domain-containing protein [Kalaharituber pfeilii]|nr:LMBR1-like membrane protein-domain-containing protein [Kalaharituber pfeilii]
MAVLPTAPIWVSAAVVLVLVILVSAIFVNTYRHRYDRDTFVSVVCVLTLTSLFATVCLLPVDIALVSSTTSNKTGLKKEWATEEVVAHMLLQLKIVYYLLYSLNAFMCLLVIPFAYFLYEEQDDESTLKDRIRGALKYCIGLIVFVFILFLVGFFVPVAKEMNGHIDLDYFRRLLVENHGERALTFITGVLLTLGTILYVIYTAPGFALLPVSMIKSVPTVSTAATASNTQQELLEIQEEIRIIEARATGGNGRRLTDKDRRSLELLQRRERTLLRKQRLENEAMQSSWWLRLTAALRPFTILFGLILLLVAMGVWVSMLLTAIDKIKNSHCGRRCGFILPHAEIFNPANAILVAASRLFPLDYVLIIFLVLDLFISTIVGLAFVGIRFLWITFFRVRKGRTRPQGLLFSTVVLTLTVLAINYALPMIIAPQYGHFGGQKYCSRTVQGHPVDCTHHPEFLLSCTEESDTGICTPTVVSTFINRVTLNFPFFGIFSFWAQFAFLGIFIVTAITSLVRTPRPLSKDDDDEFAEEEEEESLLGSSRRRVGAAWEDFASSGAANTAVGSRSQSYGSNDV